jgi:hypothetical protein
MFLLGLIAASKVKVKPALPSAGKAFALPSLDRIVIDLLVLYLVLVVVAALLTFVFKSDPPSWISRITFWVIAFGSAVFIFSR